MMKRLFLMATIAFLMSINAMAQRQKAKVAVTVDSMATVNAYLDSLLAFRQQQMAAARTDDAVDAMKPDGRYYRLFAPFTFYRSPAYRTLALNATHDSSATADGNGDVAPKR